MKIKNIVARPLKFDFAGKFRNPRFTWSGKEVLLVFVEGDDGTVGVGECWNDTGGSASTIAFIEADLKPLLLGRDADLIERFWAEGLARQVTGRRLSQLHMAMSGIDIALWDLRGKRLGQPVWRLLGGHGGPVLPYASGGLYVDGQSPDEFGREYGAYIKQGYRAVKIKVGGSTRAHDVARVAAVRQHAGPDAKLMVDAVSNLDVAQALALARAMAPHDVYWFEQPVATDDVRGMARVYSEGGIPTCGIESEYGLPAFRRLMETGAVHFVQYDLLICGGFTYGRKIANLAEAFHLPVTLHHGNGVVSMAANLHLGAALPNCDSIEAHVIHRWLFDRVPKDMFALQDGRIAPPEAPGLGLDLSDLMRAP